MVSSIGRKWDQGKDKGYEQTLGDTPPHPHSKRVAKRPDESIVDMSVIGSKGMVGRFNNEPLTTPLT